MMEVLSRFIKHRSAMFILMMGFLYQKFNLCSSLNNEGLALLKFRERVVSDPFGALSNWNDDVGVIDPCSWFGVECSDGIVVVLNLKNMCLGGTIAPELGNLVHIKSIILRNNSFSGIIPKEIGELKELELLDLGYNNFSGLLPSDLGYNLSLTILLVDNNELSGRMSPEIQQLKLMSEIRVDENELSNRGQRLSCDRLSILWNIVQTGDSAQRKLLEVDPSEGFGNHLSPPLSPSPAVNAPGISPLPESPSPSAESPSPPPKSPSPSPSPASIYPTVPSPTESRTVSGKSSNSNHHRALILSAVIGGSALLFIVAIGIVFCRSNKVATVKPWATGLSEQLQKTFMTGVPKLKRSELETACEDFSNVISSSSIGTVYKGTLSSGVEIAVASFAMTCAEDWSKNLETQFRKKIATLSKVNHKNFVNLLGYCEEEEPFTRMMVFEYAPNGTLFEHLHIKEAEHLDWGMRMRIAMGMAYCLEYMHQRTPPIPHKNLNSSAVLLTEDYAAKITDFSFWKELAAAEMESSPESNVYSFGVILFEMITGRLPYSVDSGSLEDWASDYLRGQQPLSEMVDPTSTSLQAEQLEKIGEVIKSCVHPNLNQRPAMREVTARLREITDIGPDEASPRLSPLWWAELEILTTEAT